MKADIATALNAPNPLENKPPAAAGFISYRYPSTASRWVMIGAINDADALNEARRSLGDIHPPVIGKLQRWDGTAYAPVKP